jgi:hypothetical protein
MILRAANDLKLPHWNDLVCVRGTNAVETRLTLALKLPVPSPAVAEFFNAAVPALAGIIRVCMDSEEIV